MKADCDWSNCCIKNEKLLKQSKKNQHRLNQFENFLGLEPDFYLFDPVS